MLFQETPEQQEDVNIPSPDRTLFVKESAFRVDYFQNEIKTY